MAETSNAPCDRGASPGVLGKTLASLSAKAGVLIAYSGRLRYTQCTVFLTVVRLRFNIGVRLGSAPIQHCRYSHL